MFFDESIVNARRRELYVGRIRKAINRVGIIDGCNALMLGEELVQAFQFALEHHMADWNHVELRPQIGIGTNEWVRVRGRVAERSKVQLPQPDEEVFDILISAWYQFLFFEQPVTPVVARRGNSEILSSTDEEGFFDVTLKAHPELGDFENYAVDIEVGNESVVRAEREVCEVVVPHADAKVCALVDLDGLILSQPTNRFAQILGDIVSGERSRVRSSNPTLSAFLRQLADGQSAANPLLYLSHAPRHLYQHLDAVRKYADLPEGYLHLRDFDFKLRRMTTQHSNVLEMLLAHELIDQYPDHPFVFVGSVKRASFYQPLLKAVAHRLSAVFLFGEDTAPDLAESLHNDLQIPVITGEGRRLLLHAVEQGWAAS